MPAASVGMTIKVGTVPSKCARALDREVGMSLFAEPVIWAAIFLMVFSLAAPYFFVYLIYTKIPQHSTAKADHSGGKAVGGSWLPSFSLGGPLAAYVVLVAICIGAFSWLLNTFFMQSEKDFQQFLSAEGLDVESAKYKIRKAFWLENMLKRHGVDEQIIERLISGGAQEIKLEDQLIGQYCWIMDTERGRVFGTLSLAKNRTSGIRIQGTYIDETGRWDFSSRRLAIDGEGIAYDWEADYSGAGGKGALGFSSLKYIERDTDGQVIVMKGKYSTFGVSERGQGNFFLVRLSEKYGLECPSVNKTFFKNS
jgi:hypothetical protein